MVKSSCICHFNIKNHQKVVVKGTTIKPLDLIDWEDTPNNKGGTMDRSNMGAGELTGLFATLVSVYRLASIEGREGTSNDYVTSVYEKIKNVLTGEPWNFKTLPNGLGLLFKSWLSNPSYNATIAVIDMFLYRYPSHKFSSLRVGTLNSRYKDCSCFGTWESSQRLLDLDSKHLAGYTFSPGVAREFRAITKAGEELEDPFSYMPYFKDLGLSEKSPYSTTQNPQFHFFLHSTGSLIGLRRSLNARMVRQHSGSFQLGIICGLCILS